MDLRTGELITAPQAMNGVYTWEINNPLYFTITRHQQRPFLLNQDIITVQVRFNHNLRKELGIHKCFLNFKIWTTLQPQTGLFLRVFRYQVLKYLDNIGVISINDVIRAANHVLFNVIAKTIECQLTHEIKFNVY
uniref:Replication enhancer n=1 Tax=Begomovirus manihotis TaxID=10817 RepID=A0A089FRR2_9GEMI|nr:replication enhancer [African cassava mosaic virus]